MWMNRGRLLPPLLLLPLLLPLPPLLATLTLALALALALAPPCCVPKEEAVWRARRASSSWVGMLMARAACTSSSHAAGAASAAQLTTLQAGRPAGRQAGRQAMVPGRRVAVLLLS